MVVRLFRQLPPDSPPSTVLRFTWVASNSIFAIKLSAPSPPSSLSVDPFLSTLISALFKSAKSQNAERGTNSRLPFTLIWIRSTILQGYLL
jgi:hypothetical protein